MVVALLVVALLVLGLLVAVLVLLRRVGARGGLGVPATAPPALAAADRDAVIAAVRAEAERDLAAVRAVAIAQVEREVEAARARADARLSAELAERRESVAAEQAERRAALSSELSAERRLAREQAVAEARAAGLAARESAAAELVAERAEARVAAEVRDRAAGARHQELAVREGAIAARDAALAEREAAVTSSAVDLAARVARAREVEAAAAAAVAAAEAERIRELERVAGLSQADARTELLQGVARDARRDGALLVRQLEAEARETGTARAREIVGQAIQRVASEQTTETVVSVLHLPSEEMKGRIIGREGRNIRAFEAATGVNVVIDDTPETVLLSSFDPVRREVARRTLSTLVADGRIHPQRIEDTYARALVEVEAGMQRAGEDALLAVGIAEVHPELLTLLGRLRYRTSYGQNVLAHLVETAHIAAGIAGELGIDPATVKRGAFLHDIGKAVTHEVAGSHAIVGAELARRYGEAEEVAHAIEAHHQEVAPQTLEAWLTIASDSCSGGRPGARRESLEAYVDRLARIEAIGREQPGVERVFAMSAGRELRVMVLPEEVDDLGAQVVAHDIAKRIEAELTYPGQIRVTVIRESRASETAH